MDYFQVKGTLERGQHFIHIGYDFFIDDPPEKLSIRFSYDPFWGDQNDPDQRAAISAAARTQLQMDDPAEIQAIVDQAMPLKNAISITIADPQGFRGEDHKMIPDRRFVLAAVKSSPCFSNRANTAGKYKIILHVYNVVTDSCQYKLSVSDVES